MLNRFKNSARCGFKGLVRFAPYGSVAAGVMIGGYWLVKYMSYSSAMLDGLKIRGTGGCLPSEPECVSHYGSVREWYYALDEISKNFGIKYANADLSEIWPAFVFPSMTAGLIGGAIYGFFKTPDEDFSDNENADCPEEFKDPVLYHVMRDPYALNCGGNHNLDYDTLEQLEPNAHSKLCCPLCRGEIIDPYPNTKLKNEIDLYIQNKKNKNVAIIENSKETITIENQRSDVIDAETFENEIDDHLNKEMEFDELELANNLDSYLDNNVNTVTDSSSKNQRNQLTSYKELFDFSFFALKKAKQPQTHENTITNTTINNTNRLSTLNKH